MRFTLTAYEWRMLSYTLVAAFIALGAYVFVWNRSKPIAAVIMICALSWIFYVTVDIQYWIDYFKVTPKGNLGDYVPIE